MIGKIKHVSRTLYKISRFRSSALKSSSLLRFNSTKSSNGATNPLNDMYYKRGANVMLGESYKSLELSNGVKVYMIDKSE